MELQKKILAQYMKLNGNPILKSVALDTGIQITRVFRILNGSPMKLSEFEIFKKRVDEILGNQDSLENLFFNCTRTLSFEALSEIEKLLRRKWDMWQIQQIGNQTLEINRKILA